MTDEVIEGLGISSGGGYSGGSIERGEQPSWWAIRYSYCFVRENRSPPKHRRPVHDPDFQKKTQASSTYPP
jgi:hypothetical protein